MPSMLGAILPSAQLKLLFLGMYQTQQHGNMPSYQKGDCGPHHHQESEIHRVIPCRRLDDHPLWITLRTVEALRESIPVPMW